MDEGSAEQWQLADEEAQKSLPPGVKLLRTLRGHTDHIGHIAWSPDGRMLASPSGDGIRLWDAETGQCLCTLIGEAYCVAFDPSGRTLASGSDNAIKLWEVASGRLLRVLKHNDTVFVAFDSSGCTLASGSINDTVKLWKVTSGKLLHTLRQMSSHFAFDPSGQMLACEGEGKINLWDVSTGNKLLTMDLHKEIGFITDLSFDASGRVLASTHFEDSVIRLWDPQSGKLKRTLEGHIVDVSSVSFSADGRLLVSRETFNNQLIIWRTDDWSSIAAIEYGISKSETLNPNVIFHPFKPLFATVGSDSSLLEEDSNKVIHIFELDLDVLFDKSATPSITYISAKIVLVGDAGVGKTGLGWRLAHGKFKEHSSTHGQQFWLLNQLRGQRSDGGQCEAVLWDLAGQPDYRLIHALFLDDADLVLVLFDPTRNDDPLSGVEFWLKQLRIDTLLPSGAPTMLIAARSDRGTPRLTQEELQAYCKQHGISGCLLTSAKSGEGIEELIQQMQVMIPWDAKPATITTETFKRIKDFVLNLKENSRRRKVIMTPEELRQRLKKNDRRWKFSDAEMLTAVGHLATHGYVTRLKTSQGEQRILLAPELLNNLAASFVLEARRNQKGLGSLEEQRLLAEGYKFPELEKLTEAEKDIMLDSAVVLFLEHNVGFRETDPLNGRTYLVFPELINLKKPLISDDVPIEDGVAYTVCGAVENVYASLVVLMGYTQTFIRTNQWRDHARYEVGIGHVCGFRLEAERAGEMDFVLYFGLSTPAPVRTLFQGLFESFLARHNLTVRRFEPVVCSKGHPLNRAVVREQMSSGAECAFCSRCGERIRLPKADQPIQLTKQQAEEVEVDRRAADQRSRFEQALYRLKNYVTEQKTAVPDCFISYAWGNPDQELWVERRLATDLQKAGIMVVLDRWENARIGASITRFVERVAETNRVIVVGTELYRKKYDNKEPIQSFIVAAEGDLIGKRMIGAEAKKESVLPVLLDGTEESAFPPLLQGRVYADFRNKEAYFETALELLLSLYQIPPTHQIVTELRESLKGQRER